MSESLFNAEEFLDQVTTEVNDTKVIPVPEDYYLGIAGKPQIREWKKRDGTASGILCEVPFEIEDDQARQITGRDKIMVKYSFGLDTIEVDGKLRIDTGKGKNIKLGRIREVFDLNTPGQPFGFGMFEGRQARLHVTQRAEGEDIYNDVKTVTKL